MAVLRIIEPASEPRPGALAGNLAALRARGLEVRYDRAMPQPGWPYTCGSLAERTGRLMQALLEPGVNYVLAARGGYGASDLLALLDWPMLASVPAKCLVGFSDISALHAALYTRLGWYGLHAPMPGSALWDDTAADIATLVALLGDGPPWRHHLAVEPVDARHCPTVEGVLFGGCFSVLSSLVGTPYLPARLAGTILFFEDIAEPAPRLMRFWNQWQQAGLLDGVRAIIIGDLRGAANTPLTTRGEFLTELARRAACPIFETDAFGHRAPNQPLGIGARARIAHHDLVWEIDSPETYTAQSEQSCVT